MNARHGAAVLFIAALFLALPLAAQGPVSIQTPVSFPGNTGEAIPVGPFLFSPALQLTWEDRDNIFLTPGRKIQDNIYLARARLMFEIPVYESYFRFTYTPQYREFKKYELDEKWSHFVDVGADLQFSSGVELNLNYRYVDANLESNEVDAGGELFFADQVFKKHFAKVRFDYWITNRDGITADVDYTDLKYDEINELLFYNYQRSSAGIGWLHQLTPILVMDAKYRFIKFEPEDTFVYRNSESDEITVGFEGQLSPVVAAQIRLGWRETTYDLQPGDRVQFENFSGPVIRGYLNWELAHGSSLRLDLLRSDYPSNYDFNAYYTASGGTLGYNLNRGRFFGDIFARYQNNDYEVPDSDSGLLRSDDIATFRLGLGYRFTQHFSINGAYLYEERDSLPQYTYDVNILTLSLIVGY